MAGRVAGKVAFITGAARGQGRSHAIRLAEEGADIIAVDICEDYATVGYGMATEADLADTVKAVEALDRRIFARKADVRDLQALKAALDAGVAELGKLDIVSANAGICTVQAWDDVTPAVWQDTIDTNLTGVWNTLAVSIPHLLANGGGSIIATSSTAGIKGLPFLGPYTAAKHGVVGICRSLAQRAGRQEHQDQHGPPDRRGHPDGGRPRRPRRDDREEPEPRAAVHERAPGRDGRAARHQQRGPLPRLRRGQVRDRPRVHR